jgi:signal transduction histidine kinase
MPPAWLTGRPRHCALARPHPLEQLGRRGAGVVRSLAIHPTVGPAGGESPRAGNLWVLIEWTRLTHQGDFRRCVWRYPRNVVTSWTSAVDRRFAAWPRSTVLLDVAIAFVALAASLALLSRGGVGPPRPGSRELDLMGVALVAGSTVPIMFWRRSPLGVFVVTAAAGVVLAGLGFRMDLLVGPAVALYLLAASRPPQTRWTWRSTVTVVGLLVAYLVAAAAAQGAFPISELSHTGLAWAVAWFAGERTRLRHEQIAELNERAVRAEREADRERLLAAAEERARIARDLHDSAGHAISVIAVRAGAARLRHKQDPDRSLLALEAIEVLARQTAGEIDQLVGSLREGGSTNEDVAAPPCLASLDTLIARHQAAGLEVTLDTSGAPRPLAAAADQAAYRILQEALTNAARHGVGSAQIRLAFGDTGVEVGVTNPVPTGSSPRSGGGHGLVGMRERATLLGGNLEADRANGEFRLSAHIPYGGQRG